MKSQISYQERREILIAESKAKKKQKDICKSCNHANRYQCDYCLNK